MHGKGLVSYLAADWGEVVASVALPRWSPSLLLYKGREVGDLMSGVPDCDGEEGIEGFDAVSRSSIVPVLCAEHRSQWKPLGKRVRAGDVRERQRSLYELGEPGR